jgi:hypothetical protein
MGITLMMVVWDKDIIPGRMVAPDNIPFICRRNEALAFLLRRFYPDTDMM